MYKTLLKPSSEIPKETGSVKPKYCKSNLSKVLLDILGLHLLTVIVGLSMAM